MKIIILEAYAGHGKDYAESIISKNVNSPKKIAFADTLKEIIASNISERIHSKFPDLSSLELLDHLKNEKFDINVYKNLNMRNFLVKLLGGAIRDIEKDIHCLFLIKKIETDIIDKKDHTYICTDNRYINEQNYLINININKTLEQKINYIRTKITEKLDNISIDLINDKFNDYFGSSLNKEEDKFIKNIKRDFIYKIEQLYKTLNPEYKIKDQCIDIDISNLSKEDSFNKFGVIHIFRPLIPLSGISNKLNISEIKKEILSFTTLNNKQIDNVISVYNTNNIDFNVENIHKFGFLRTNPLHESESQLNEKRKPKDALLNIFNNQISDFPNYLSLLLDSKKKSKKRDISLK